MQKCPEHFSCLKRDRLEWATCSHKNLVRLYCYCLRMKGQQVKKGGEDHINCSNVKWCWRKDPMSKRWWGVLWLRAEQGQIQRCCRTQEWELSGGWSQILQLIWVWVREVRPKSRPMLHETCLPKCSNLLAIYTPLYGANKACRTTAWTCILPSAKYSAAYRYAP